MLDPSPAAVPEARTTLARSEPSAREHLDRMVAAYRSLSSFSARAELRNMSIRIAFQKPNKIIVETDETQVNPALLYPVSRMVSDGTHLFAISPRDKSRYRKEPALPGAATVERAITEVTLGCFLRELLQAKDPVKTILSTSSSLRLKSLSVDPGDQVSGMLVDTVVAVISGPKQGESRITFKIGHEDHLLRQLSVASILPDGKSVVYTETYTEVQANPALPEATFTFTPPPGAQAVTSWMMPIHPALKVGARPFPLQTKDTAGKSLSLEQYQGKVVLLDFWATWCGPCVAEIPNLVAVYRKFRSRGFEVISISADSAEDRAKLAAFVRKNRMTWRQIHDPQSTLSKQYGVTAYPTTLLIGRKGTIVAVDLHGEALEGAARAALGAK